MQAKLPAVDRETVRVYLTVRDFLTVNGGLHARVPGPFLFVLLQVATCRGEADRRTGQHLHLRRVRRALRSVYRRPPPKLNPTSPEELPTERLLEQLQAIEATVQGKGSQLQRVVELLRSRDVSWAQIGGALGISRQSAWERFT